MTHKQSKIRIRIAHTYSSLSNEKSFVESPIEWLEWPDKRTTLMRIVSCTAVDNEWLRSLMAFVAAD